MSKCCVSEFPSAIVPHHIHVQEALLFPHVRAWQQDAELCIPIKVNNFVIKQEMSVYNSFECTDVNICKYPTFKNKLFT